MPGYMLKSCFFSVLFILLNFCSFAQGTETFINIPPNSGTYTINNWTGDNGLPWSATDSRTDQVINGRAITIRNGSVFCNNIPNGVADISFKHQQFFTGSNPVLQLYINNVLVGTANPAVTQATSTFTGINVSGSFNLEIRQVTAGLRIGIDDVTWTSYGGVPCTEPSNQPTTLMLSSTPTTVNGSFTAASPAVDEYLIVRSTSATLASPPADGTAYTAGQTLGGGTVVASTTSLSFTDIGLTPSTLYHYFIFAHNNENCSGGPNYLQLNPLTGNVNTQAIPACITPSAAPTNLILNPGNISVSGSYTAAAGANRYLVVRSLSSTLAATPVNGTTYSAGQAFGGGTVVTYTFATNFTALGLTPGTLYYFFVFSASGDCTGEPFYNTTSLNGSTTTLSGSGIPPGYYDAADALTCAPLKTALFGIISANYNQLSYTPGVWNAYQTTDLHRNDANNADIMWDMYSDNPVGPEPYTYTFSVDQCGTYNSESDCYNREHSFPSSWFDDNYPMYTDLNHLFPTDGYVNNRRSNFPFGEVSAPTWTSQNGGKLGPNTYPGFTGTVFEPRNEYKGDFARAHLYMATRYENLVAGWIGNGNANDVLNGTSYPAFDNWDIKLMYKWHTQDPVSQKEVDRNNAVYALQGNRNPFIDHPEYVYMVWQCTGLLPVTIIDFTAQKNNGSVLLRWYATQETNFKQYEIQRSTDGASFYKIGEVAGRNLADYSFTDHDLPAVPVVYYRLKMIDIDGKFDHSKIVPVRLGNYFSNVLIYPNPAKGNLSIKLQNTLTENSKLIISDLTGRTVLQKQVPGGQRNIDTDVSQLSAGRYFIRISNSNEVVNQSFIISR
jgi:endonuclease I